MSNPQMSQQISADAYRQFVHPLRRVVRTKFTINKYNRPGEGSVRHTLECGHEVIQKLSAGFPKRKRCRECYLKT
jgi:hypothetical protein